MAAQYSEWILKMQDARPAVCAPEQCSTSFARRAMARLARQAMAGCVSRSDSILLRRSVKTRAGAARYATPISLK